MYAVLTLIRYRKPFVYFALTAMALHRIPLLLNRRIRFHKTLGCGKGGTFSRQPDWQQYGLLVVLDEADAQFLSGDTGHRELQRRAYGRFITGWWHFFGCETWTLVLRPIEGHGHWDGREAFGPLPPKSDYEGMIGILTRATLRRNKQHRFWEHVEAVSNDMRRADGFLFSVGIGETPWLRQATFSMWESKRQMKEFAYKTHQHADVIRKTRSEDWYSEDMFVRFQLLRSIGTLEGRNPLPLP
ncbi:MAG TPA: spheroidene monooxygenase [Lacibacter sp.]|nr:spheroidene monooxygenase [Lacibacter sp.]HMO90403.1 spheroidene monooxygenase [Lacibacter sp.]HMP86786.1 spheroidene monooxygenase [Lacibacter sp.]